ncbi:hypothetical protein TSAR_011503 [Trichomalopsis sarcophagae]|uniref:Reverse transcriptase domain-containing protein n=1 Tax=Trichomalopsis sarcophagae TaxID=543379 RepID=A0A232FK75_9HYME|nr:hypothetical protein TSAR_011503 [Trichomalopsis sarcophagae]
MKKITGGYIIPPKSPELLDRIVTTLFLLQLEARPDVFVDLYNSCLDEGTFPKNWKKQRLVLLPKGDEQPGEASLYRPLCMLDTLGKILDIKSSAEAKGFERFFKNGFSNYNQRDQVLRFHGRAVTIRKEIHLGWRHFKKNKYFTMHEATCNEKVLYLDEKMQC